MRIPLVNQVISLVRKPGVPVRRTRPREERVRDAMQHAPVGIGVSTCDGHWLFVNDRFRATVGYTREELARLSLQALTHPEDAKKETALMKRLITSEIESYRIEKRVMAKTGRYRAVEVLTSAAREAGEVDLLIYVIDEPQHTPKRLEPDRILSNIVEQLVDVAVIRTDERGVITGWNAGAQRVFGYTREEIVGKNRRTLYRDHDSWEGKSTGILENAAGGRIEMEDWRVTKDGRHIWIRSAIVAFKPDGSIKGYVETVVAPPAPAPQLDASPVVEQLRAEIEKRRGAEESLRSALQDLSRSAEETMNELRIMTAALRDEIDRRKTVEDELRSVNEKLAAVPPAAEIEEEMIVTTPPKRAWHALEGSFADVLRKFSGRTGTLIAVSGGREKEIFFENGLIFSCASNDPEKFLTHRLLADGVISEEQREKALEIKQASQLALGRILLILGAIDEQQLVDAMRTKVADEIDELLSWTEARYAFVEGDVPSLQLVPLRLDPAELLDVPVYVVSAKSNKVHKDVCISAKRISAASRVVVKSLHGYDRCRLCLA
jgi:PAS domain S-box-containing protein